MVRNYKKFISDEIHLAERAPDVSTYNHDKPAGDFSRIQRKRWKIWVDCSSGNIYVRKSKLINDWRPIVVPSLSKYSGTHNIVAGANTITHGLNLGAPQGFIVNAIDSSGGTVVISSYTAFTANSFTFTSASALGIVTITVI